MLRSAPGALRATLTIASLGAASITAAPAHAYTWMISHGYTTCNQCHFDPSGGGLLTAYGRAQGELLLRTTYGEGELEDPGPAGEFAFGLVPLPEPLAVGLSYRGAMFGLKAGESDLSTDYLLMQADARAHLKVGPVRAYGSVALGIDGGGIRASLTTNDKTNLLSREHWIGVDLGAEDQFLVRAGRIALPYGVRGIEHTMWTRRATRTDINDAQQHGVAVAYNGENLRGEVMAILGNFQASPDTFRERGYSGYVEYFFDNKTALGVSSMLTNANTDVALQVGLVRQAHGLFVRKGIGEHVVVLAETDLLVNSPSGGDTQLGNASLLQVDWELTRGVHLMPAVELLLSPTANAEPGLGAWISATWFFWSHMDIRLDTFLRNTAAGTERVNTFGFLGQFHFYL